MKKQYIFFLLSGIALFSIIYFFGNTNPPVEANAQKKPEAATASSFDFDAYMTSAKSQLPANQQEIVAKFESAVVRGDVKAQQTKVYKQLAEFWKDSAHLLIPYAYYSGLASKLENSEKSLTFAAQYFLEGIRQQADPSLKNWMALQAKELLEKSLELNPANDSSKVGLGACYIFGNISDNPMQGLSLVREVLEKDSNNVYGQFILGLGGIESGQYAKAAVRLEKVLKAQPQNLEAIMALAECYQRLGDKEGAIKWFSEGKKFFVNAPEVANEIQAAIDQLKK